MRKPGKAAYAKTQHVNSFPAGAAAQGFTAKQTYADLHAGDMKAQAPEAFPDHGYGAGD